MAETHNRVMESGGWSTTDVWPVPVECLLNGMTAADPHLMFGGGHMIQHPFRQRFQSPLQQLNGPPQHLVSINPNVTIPSHSIIENNVTVDGNGQVEVNGEGSQDTLSQNMPMNDNVLDESEDSSDADEDLSQSGPQMSLTHGLNDNSLVQVPCGGDQVAVQVQDNMVHSQLPMNGDPHNTCHHQKLRNDVTVMNHHALHDPPINPLFFQEQDHFEPPPVVVDDAEDDGGNDPNTGFSVYGKLYYEREGRVVLHLKQWLDSESDQGGNGLTFDPSDPLQGKNLIQGCALCRLSSSNQDSYRNQKQGHRHTFRGVLFTFEECTIVELYPEQNHPITSAHNGLKPNDTQRKILEQQQNGQRLMPTYLPPPVEDQIQQQQQHLEMNQLQATSHPPEHKVPPPPAEHQAWWDEFESEEELKDDDSSDLTLTDDEVDPSSPIREQQQQEIVTVVIGGGGGQGGHDPCFPEESTYQTNPDSPYMSRQEAECETTQVVCDESQNSSPVLDSLILIEHHQQQPAVVEEEDENLATPKNQEAHADEIGFNLVESEVEDISPVVHQSPPPPPLPPPSPLPRPQKLRGKFECPCCTKSFPVKKTLKNHLDIQHMTNPLRCDKCRRQFTDEKSVTKHVCIEVNLGQRSATPTGQRSNTPKGQISKAEASIKIGQEISEVKGANMNKIKETSQIEPAGTNFKKDKKRHHVTKSKVRTSPTKQSTKPFPCNLCAKTFSVQRRLDTHRLSHVNDKSSQCEKCGKRFARKDKLMRHMFVHSEEKMFECTVCSKRFSRRDKLADHLKSHGGPEETHHCPLCKKEFLRPDILKQHVKLHGMGNKHQCPECLRFVTGRDRLQQHMARHEEAKAQGQPLLCPLCTKNFIQRQSLKAHIKKFHPSAHARLLSDLEFPPDPLEVDTELDEAVPIPKQGTEDNGASAKESQRQRVKFSCEFCPKRFSKKGPLLRHVSKKHESQIIVPEPNKPVLEYRKKGKKIRKVNGTFIHKKNKIEPDTVPVLPLKSSPDPGSSSSSCSTIIPDLTFTSAASQIVSPPMSPVSTEEQIRISQDIGLGSTAHEHGLASVHAQDGGGFHLAQSAQTRIPITLATVSVNSNPVSSGNGILSHSLHHAHALLQHAHPLAQALPPMAHPQGQIHTHISHVTMPHHVAQAQQAMCGTPYVIYPHYY